MADDTKELLQKLLTDLYLEQAKQPAAAGDSFLRAGDGQFLGQITASPYGRESILNPYGPYGSQYSATSIFNKYSKYGSQYGQYSINNPYTGSPPDLFIAGQKLGRVTANKGIPDRISNDAFLYTLRSEPLSLLEGRVVANEEEARRQSGESFIQAADGKFLGSIKPSPFAADSLFNQFSPYGNQFSPDSIFNTFGPYGGIFNELSPYNSLSGRPPQIFVKGVFWGYLTKNVTLQPRVDPDEIEDWAERNVQII